jgi:metal-responsive CopG/Arc/MetJ family transcriptional regulator
MGEPAEGGKMNVLLLLEKNVLARVDDFRFANRINTRAEAMRQLIEIGLAQSTKKATAAKPRAAAKPKQGI